MNNSNPILFSIITPVYNRADCIIRCIDSVATQDFISYEHIVINDGSTDNTLDKIKLAESKLANIKIITYTENKGVNYARNRGIELAKGKFIIFLDSDDELTRNALTSVEEIINKYPEYSHYFFGVSDRHNDKNLPNRIYESQFKDWLSGKLSGDFAHVIQTSCFNGLMFIEEFRIYEDLNWGRVLRKNQKQLFSPIVILDRERDRLDSVTRESTLDNKISMLNTYNYLYQFINWYSNDFRIFNLSGMLQSKIKKGLYLGIALGETYRNKQLIMHLNCSTIKLMFFKFINRRIYSSMFYLLIKIKSLYNQFKRNKL